MTSRYDDFDFFGAQPEPEAPKPRKSKALSVSAALGIAKTILQERTFHITGEVSELSDKPGYKAVYFTIKDQDASLPCMMWKNRYMQCDTPLRIGAKVEVKGRFTIFAPKGRMNFDVFSLSLAGDGDLRAKVARLAERLRVEGLMDQTRKRALPAYPTKIGLVTSPRGAAVHDVLRTLRRRYPLAQVFVAGVAVEGKNAPRDLIAGLDAAVGAGVEEILLVRGGGSFEDLMPFNDEALARAIADCPVPVVTGIGHEPDTSIADMVADLRCSTPTAAAEAVAPHAAELRQQVSSLGARMGASFGHRLKRSEQYLDQLASRPVLRDPLSLFATDFQMLDVLSGQMERAMGGFVPQRVQELDQVQERLTRAMGDFVPQRVEETRLFQQRLARAASAGIERHHVGVARGASDLKRIGSGLLSAPYAQAAVATARLNDLSPLRTLERGWSIAKSQDGTVVSSVSQLDAGQRIRVQFKDGIVSADVVEVEADAGTGAFHRQ